ncbi:tetratricopeptide repeat protein [Roseimaritima ulvae]|nr:tetratricopeptide repeat protein [Roseimaritima ulvae]
MALVVCWLLLSMSWSEVRGEAPQPVDRHAARHATAIEAAAAAVERTAANPQAIAYIRLGDAQLRAGHSAQAVANFEKALALQPEQEPYLWQYGIALYFVERYRDGRVLFEKHRRVNPNDVENAAWHFLCAAKETDLATARKILLPAPADRRAPMKQILQRLPGGQDTAIEAAVQELKGTAGYASARLYADLYIGMIADAEGDSQKAQRYLQRAATTELTSYMADVARVYANHVK